MSNSQWRRDHEIAHLCYLTGRIPQTLTRDSVRREDEFERALEERGQEAARKLED
jgi:hypothetical protein